MAKCIDFLERVGHIGFFDRAGPLLKADLQRFSDQSVLNGAKYEMPCVKKIVRIYVIVLNLF